jgi:hypothetical protein
MRPEMTGVLVSRINPLSDAYKVLKKDDILLEFDGVPIANDGTGELKLPNMHWSVFCVANFCFLYVYIFGCINYLTILFIILFKYRHLAYYATYFRIADR